MAESLNVIALISGGKDSLFSIFHCLANGHKIVALANLHPPGATTSEEKDMDSFMYQTVGHSIIPLYAEALGIPLYRQEILGYAVNTSRDYSAPQDPKQAKNNDAEQSDKEGEMGEKDETESLKPLLCKIIADHPEANAVSTGAILSTYQRTRVESIAMRLNLVPLSYLWQYPVLPPYTQSGLLADMAKVGMDARIIKVASGGLDQSFLWENVADPKTVSRLRKAMSRFGENGDGAVLGEGGEFETLAIDGPSVLFKKRIEVQPNGFILGDGGNAIFRSKDARVVEKELGEDEGLEKLRIPEMWDDEFKTILDALSSAFGKLPPTIDIEPPPRGQYWEPLSISQTQSSTKAVYETGTLSLYNLTSEVSGIDASSQMQNIHSRLNHHLTTHKTTPDSILHVTLLLRDMSDFPILNPIYSRFFTTPNPPSRVTVSCGSSMPDGVDVMLSAIISAPHCVHVPDDDPSDPPLPLIVRNPKSGLHVQSRSYWAPANIGPYSQAISTALSPQWIHQTDSESSQKNKVVYLAGQIPLIPSTMAIYNEHGFVGQTVLSLQHLYRIGRALNVHVWLTGIAFISNSGPEAQERVRVAQMAWREMYQYYVPKVTSGASDEDTDSEGSDGEGAAIDPWDLRNRFRDVSVVDDITTRAPIPNPEFVKWDWESEVVPRCVVAEVESLPRGADIEWHSTGLSLASRQEVETMSQGTKGTMATLKLCRGTCFHIEFRIGDSSIAVGLELKTLLGGGYVENAVLYAGSRMGRHYELDLMDGVQIVPCKRVWGDGGKEVMGVLVVRMVAA